MARKPLLSFILVLALSSLACGISIPVQVKTGPTVTDDIHVPYTPGNTQAYAVTLSFGAGNFTLKPGAEGAVVSGSATYNVEDFKPKVTINQNVIHVEQGNLKLGGIPNFKNNIRNDWLMQLGDVPMRLSVDARRLYRAVRAGRVVFGKPVDFRWGRRCGPGFLQPEPCEHGHF